MNSTVMISDSDSDVEEIPQNSGRASAVIDLTEPDDKGIPIQSDNDELQITKIVNPSMVCYGVTQTIATHVQLQHLQEALGNLSKVRVLLEPRLVGNCYEFMLKSSEPSGPFLGKFTRSFNDVVLHIRKTVQFEVFMLKRGMSVNNTCVHVNLYGPSDAGPKIGSYLLRVNIRLHQPEYCNLLYSNPQDALLACMPSTHNSDASPSDRVLETKSKIDSIYQSLTAACDLPTMEPSATLTTSLYKHQKQGLYFMFDRELEHDIVEDNKIIKNTFWRRALDGTFYCSLTGSKSRTIPRMCRGGILADDMGIGKTIQMIALILRTMPKNPVVPPSIQTARNQGAFDLHSFSKVGQPAAVSFDHLVPSKATLIICPLSVVSNWEDQIEAHCQPGILSVYVHHGPNRYTNPETICSYDVVISTYSTVAKGSRKKVGLTEDEFTSPLHCIYWHRIILDEAHTIKSYSTLQARSIFQLHAQKRWCLSGTPIQNRFTDLYSLVKFLQFQPFDIMSDWTTYISRPLTQDINAALALSRLHTLMKAITLRRTKTLVIDGKPILDLPPKEDRCIKLVLPPKERELYTRIQAECHGVFTAMQNGNGSTMNYVHILEAILRMRQACSHPKLSEKVHSRFRSIGAPSSVASEPQNMTVKRARHLLAMLRDADMDKCSICDGDIDDTEHSIWFSKCEHLYCHECAKDCIKSGSSFTCLICKTELTRKSMTEFPNLNSSGTTDNDDDDVFDVDELDAQNHDGYPVKVDALLQQLIHVRDSQDPNDRPVKSVVFSQWTRFLKLLEEPLKEHGFKFVTLKGDMNRQSRTQALHQFNNNPKVVVLLLSLKTGGVGLNLTIASQVYLMEPYWNPATEQQAMDRLYRLGQTRTVKCVRFIVQDTIEENMLAIQQKKIQYAKSAFKDEASGIFDTGDEDGLAVRRGVKRGRGEEAERKRREREERINDLKSIFMAKPVTS